MKNLLRERVQFRISLTCGLLLVFCCGMVAARYKIFPYQVLATAKLGFEQLRTAIREIGEPPEYCTVDKKQRLPIYNSEQSCDGLNVVTRIGAGGVLSVDVMDCDGENAHRWTPDWFDIWSDANHVPEKDRPKSRPGTQINGSAILENGNLVFNFDRCGLVCLDPRGHVVWRLAHRTHHSVTIADDGNIWVCGQTDHDKPCDRFPNIKAAFIEDLVLEVNPDGEIARKWSVFEILRDNGYEGLISRNSRNPKGDRLHLNDVEPFPASMQEGVFKKGDVMVSLRNIDTVFVFNKDTGKIRFICTGLTVWQHDPDFIDGNTISVFNNRTDAEKDGRNLSRIDIISARDGTAKVYYAGTPKQPFYTDIMGRHQWLPNGNLLITEARNGRAFEVDHNGKIVWEYNNVIEEGRYGCVEDVFRLPLDYVAFSNPEFRRQMASKRSGKQKDTLVSSN